jgi:predicted RNA polymerase sigma factor
VAASDTHRAIDAVWRIESARLIAGLARMVRDVGLAEDLAQEALVAALERWPESGVPRRRRSSSARHRSRATRASASSYSIALRHRIISSAS